MEVSFESPGRLFGRLVLPDARAVGAGLPGLPGSCHSELLNFAVEGVDGVFGSGS